MTLFIYSDIFKSLLPILAILAAVFVITTKNAIISVFNLIVLYILVAFYLIFIGVTYMGISYIIIYIGAIAILFLFVIMMIDIEVIEKRNNNYLFLLFLLLSGFFLSLKNIITNIGIIKMKSFLFKEEKIYIDNYNTKLFDNSNYNSLNKSSNPYNYLIYFSRPTKDNTIDKIKGHDFFNYKDNMIISEELNDIKSKNERSFFSVYNFLYGKNNYLDESFLLLNKNNLDKTKNNLFLNNIFDLETSKTNKNDFFPLIENEIIINNSIVFDYNKELHNNNYLLIIPDWDSALNYITQISAVGDVLYTVYHTYIYILSALLLLGMIGAIILTANSNNKLRVINIENSKKSNIFSLDISKIRIYIINFISIIYKNIYTYINFFWNYKTHKRDTFIFYKNIENYYLGQNAADFYKKVNNLDKENKLLNRKKENLEKWKINKTMEKLSIFPFYFININEIYSEDILGNLFYFIIANIIIALLLLFINFYFSLSIKYLEKGGGFECGFTSFVQTRERFNVIFYRVSLLFLIFDLEIILVFPYTAIYQKNQNISKNNVLFFLYILIVGFIYELKEGAINIVKKAHSLEPNNTK